MTKHSGHQGSGMGFFIPHPSALIPHPSEKNVARFQIAVEDAVPVSVMNGACDLGQEVGR